MFDIQSRNEATDVVHGFHSLLNRP